jgi:broad specificity phosphatase PhoE
MTQHDLGAHDSRPLTMVLVRHGNSQANARGVYSGTLDVDVTAEGLAEIEEYRREGLYPATQRHYSSPLRRCLQTFRAAYGKNVALDGIIDDFHELCLGDLEGKSLGPEGNEMLWASWVVNGSFARSFHVESLAHASARGSNAVRRLALACSADGVSTVSVVTHSAIMRSALMGLAALSAQDWGRMSVPNGMGYVLSLDVSLSSGAVSFLRATPLDPSASDDAVIVPNS